MNQLPTRGKPAPDISAPIRSDARAVLELAEFVRRLATDNRAPFLIQAQAIQLIRSLQQ
jgi:hypothetical protein